MTYQSHSNGPAMVRLFRVMGSNQLPTTYGDPNNMQYQNDTLFTPQGNTTGYYHGIITDPVPVVDVLGVSPFDTQRVPDTSFLTGAPSVEEWSSRKDWLRYGGILGSIAFAANNKDKFPVPEHPVTQAAFRGDIRDVNPTDRYVLGTPPLTFSYKGATLERFKTYPTSAYGKFQSTGINSQGYFTFVNTVGYGTHPTIHADWFANISRLIDFANGGTITSHPHARWWFTWSNISGSCSKDGNAWNVEVDYLFERLYNQGNGPLWAKFSVHIGLKIDVQPVYGYNNPNDVLVPNAGIFRVYDTTSVVFHSRGGVYNPNILPIVQLSIKPEQPVSAFSPIVQRDESVSSSRFFIYRKSGSNNTGTLHNRVLLSTMNMLGELRPSAFYSASDALQGHIEVLEANHLENLTQLTGLLSILPNLSKLPRLVSRLTKGDPSAIVDTVDYITDAIIKFRYAQSPTAGDALELITTDVLAELNSLLQSKTYTLYGGFSWEFPESDNYMGDGRLTLDTRSKVNITIDMSTFLANYLTLNSMGLLPTLSRSWASVPFSFVVDWFTNMDDRLQQVDNQLLWMVVRTNWLLHSYKVSYYPSDDILSSYGLENVNPDEPFHITAFIREPSLVMPLLRDSRFDFLAPNHGPDPLTVGALTWQKLRS